jgi:prefoldin subunit 5
MKESTLLEMQNKIAALTRVVQQMINEMNILSTTAMGTLETVKLIPGYDRAIELLKKEADKLEKEKQDGVKQQDTK